MPAHVEIDMRVMAVTRMSIGHGSNIASPFRHMRRTAMNRLSLIAIGGSLTALGAALPANAKSPAPLPAEARVTDIDSDAERLQLQALWAAARSCPADAAFDFLPQRVSDGCVNRVIVRESGDDLAMHPKSDN
jgi:hypothetical protein